MTRDEKIAWLKRYAEAEREIDRITENIQRWASRRKRMGGSIMSAPSQVASDCNVVERATERIAELQHNLLERIDEHESVKAEIEAAISALESGKQREVLRHRYLEGATFERVAVEMCYSYRQVMNIHREAMNILMIA